MATTIGDLTEPLRVLVRGFLDAYPEARARDVYRLIRDGTCTGETPLSAEAALQQLQGLAADAGKSGQLLVETSVDGRLVRVNVGPYVAAGGDLKLLAEAAARTSTEHRPQRDRLFTLWAGFVHMNRRHEFRLEKADLEHFEMTIATSGYPSVEHSPEFVREYDPRYVVVLRELLPPIE